jgi:hypothetical protein
MKTAKVITFTGEEVRQALEWFSGLKLSDAASVAGIGDAGWAVIAQVSGSEEAPPTTRKGCRK